jgi:hypothetical protein
MQVQQQKASAILSAVDEAQRSLGRRNQLEAHGMLTMSSSVPVWTPGLDTSRPP